MKWEIRQYWIVFCLLPMLSGCGRLVDWAKESFYQGDELYDYSNIPRQFLRWVSVYDQFETLGIFDALWLSVPVRASYARLHACRHGKSVEHEKAFLRRQLEENKHFIDFYVLSLYRQPLDIEGSYWSIFLEIDGQRYAPREIKTIDLAPEYKFFFGKHDSRFKLPYLIRFNAYDIENKKLINAHTRSIMLILRSVEKEVVLSWKFSELPLKSGLDCEYKERR